MQNIVAEFIVAFLRVLLSKNQKGGLPWKFS